MQREIGMNRENMNKNTVNLLSKAKQSKAKPKIVSLINNSFKIVLLILLFSISCKSKQKPEEKYNGIIPQGFSGKYILINDGNQYFETTSSNAIIGSDKNYRKGVLPLVLEGTNDYAESINGKAITYREVLGEDRYYRYRFYTNRKDKKRTLDLGDNLSSVWWNS